MLPLTCLPVEVLSHMLVLVLVHAARALVAPLLLALAHRLLLGGGGLLAPPPRSASPCTAAATAATPGAATAAAATAAAPATTAATASAWCSRTQPVAAQIYRRVCRVARASRQLLLGPGAAASVGRVLTLGPAEEGWG